MNRRKFLNVVGLAPAAAIAVVASARAALASPQVHTFGQMRAYVGGVSLVGESGPEVVFTPSQLKAMGRPFTVVSLETIASRRYSVDEICRMYSIHLEDIGGAT